MANRWRRRLVATTAFVCAVGWVHVGTAASGTGPAHRKEKRQTPFMELCVRILSGNLEVADLTHLGGNGFAPFAAEHILATRKTSWAFGRITTRLHDPLDGISIPSAWLQPGPIKLQPIDFSGTFSLAVNPLNRYLSLYPDKDADDASFGALFAPETAYRESTRAETDFAVKSNGAPLGYRYTMENLSVNAGVAWIYDLNDTSGTARAFNQAGYVNAPDSMTGVNLMLGASYGSFTLTGGYIRAMDQVSNGEKFLADRADEPVAWNSEIAYSTELLRRDTTLAIGYQKSSQALLEYLPEERFITKASMLLFEETSFSLEYYLDKDLPVKYGEEAGYGLTTRIGFGF